MDRRHTHVSGTLWYVGRKNSQVKIRGQRVELHEIEQQAYKHLADRIEAQIVVEVVRPTGSSDGVLVGFVSQNQASGGSRRLSVAELSTTTNALQGELADVLPAHMMPTAYVSVEKVPTTTTNKVDRRKLREIGAAYTLEQLVSLSPLRKEHKEPTSSVQLWVRQAWTDTLGIDPASISLGDIFARTGGDSIKVPMLVRSIREKFEVEMTVRKFLRQKTLENLAGEIERLQQHDSVHAIRQTQLGPYRKSSHPI